MRVSFCSNSHKLKPIVLSETKARNVYSPFLSESKPIHNPDVFIRDIDSLAVAVDHLRTLKFDDSDVKKVKRYGVVPSFRDGAEAVDYARKQGISVVFGPILFYDVHAQWINKTKTVVINDRYQDTRDAADIYAISAALLHELSHAKDGDGESSIQEEINCLGMNALAFSAFRRKNPRVFDGAQSPIIKDGVELYSNLFMGDDENALINRIRLKYGDLPLESPGHAASTFAKKIKK